MTFMYGTQNIIKHPAGEQYTIANGFPLCVVTSIRLAVSEGMMLTHKHEHTL